MNFDEALSLMTNGPAKKFAYYWHLEDRISQDILDEMLATIGWEYEIGCGEDYGKIIAGEWYPSIWRKEEKTPIHLWDFYPDKLSAAKAAFTAIVEMWATTLTTKGSVLTQGG